MNGFQQSQTALQNIVPVVASEQLSSRFYRLSLDAPAIAGRVRAGQFVHIKTTDGLVPFFRRPFSVYRAREYVEIFYEVLGPGTRALAAKRPGDMLDVLGPVGEPFTPPPEGVKRVVMIAGGIGVAPFLILSDALRDKGYELILLYGGRTKDHTYDMSEFEKNGCAVHVATDDGSVGVKGRVSSLFDRIHPDAETTYIYTCGPNPMMAAVQAFAVDNGIRGQAACEEVMACALGACLGCSIQTTKGYRTVCYDGPVFDLQEVIFEDRT